MSKRWTRMPVCMAALAAAIMTATSAPSSAQNVTLRYSHWLPPVHVMHKTAVAPWAASVEKASKGTIRVQIFPAQQLGQAGDHYDMAASGIADLTYVNPGYQAGRFPMAAASELPFLVEDVAVGSEVFHRWYAKYAEKEMPEIKVCNTILFAPGAIHSSKPIRVPDDMKGVKGRAAQATLARLFAMLGGSSVPISAPEVRDALERGVVDMATAPWGSMIRPWGLDQAVKHTLDMSFYSGLNLIALNRAAYDKLSPEQKAVIDDHCSPEWSRRMAAGWQENEVKGRKELLGQKDRVVHVPSKDEVQQWRQAMAPIVDEWRKAAKARGFDADAALKELRGMLQKAGAAAD